MWGDEAAERAEMNEPSEPLAVDGTPRLNPLQRFYVDEDQVRSAAGNKREADLQKLLAYLQAEGAKKAHSAASAYRRNAYADAAGRLLKILEGEP